MEKRVMNVLKTVGAYDIALLKAAWHLEGAARNIALNMTGFGKHLCFEQKSVGVEECWMRWAVDTEKSKTFDEYNVTDQVASDDFLFEMLSFDLLRNVIRIMDSTVGYKREGHPDRGDYLFSFKLDDGCVVDVCQSPVDTEMIWFEIDGDVVVHSGEFSAAVKVDIVG